MCRLRMGLKLQSKIIFSFDSYCDKMQSSLQIFIALGPVPCMALPS
jgi:hypothetical protein